MWTDTHPICSRFVRVYRRLQCFDCLAVAHSARVILDHALQHRAVQVARIGVIRISQSQKRTSGLHENKQGGRALKELVTITDESPPLPTYIQPSSFLHANEAWLRT